MSKVAALVRTWLLIDFFGEARRAGRGHGSSLTTTIFTQSFFALVFAALLYPETPPVPFAAANLCLSSLLLAIGALGDDSRPERRAADEHLLSVSPLSRGTIALARAGHAAFALVLVTVGMALAPAILLASLTGAVWLAPAYVLGACACSALATGVLGVLARGSTRWFGAQATALWLGSLKAVLLGGGLVLFAISLPLLKKTAAALPIGELGAELLPPYHVARWLAAPGAEAWRLLVLVAAGGALLLAAMALDPTRGGARARVRRTGLPLRLLRRLTAPGPARAIAEFTAIGMWRGAGFRARVLPLLGVPIAMVFLATRSGADANTYVLTCVVLQLPAIYLPFLVMFLPRADQPGAAWVFAQSPRLGRALVQDAVWRALVTHVLLPVFTLAALLAIVSGRAGADVLAAAVFAFGVAVLAARVAARALDVVPFTVASEGDSGPDLGGLFGSAIVLGGCGAAFGLWLPAGLRWPVAVAGLAAAVAALLRRGDRRGEDAADAADAEGADGAAGSLADQAGAATAATTGGAGTHERGIPTATAGAASEARPRGERGPVVGGGPSPEPRSGDAEHADHAEAARAAEDPTGPHRAPPTLRRELRAIAVLYAFLSVLPLLVGTIFAD